VRALLAPEYSCDEDEAACMLARRPRREFDRRVGQDAARLHQHRPAAAFDLEKTLHAEEIGAAQRDKVSIARE